MRDIEWLFRRLQGAGLTAPLLAVALSGAACEATKVNGADATTSGQGGEDPVVEEGDEYCPDPSAPSATKEQATACADGDEVDEGLGCPTSVSAYVDDPAADCGWVNDAELADTQYIDTEATQERRDAGDPDTCVYSAELSQPCGHGRPLRDDGATVVAPLVDAAGPSPDDWRGAPLAPEAAIAALAVEDRAALARAWAEDALAEHASVASFARASLELMAVGAPPSLVAETHQAALDEIRHASIALALASQYSGRALEPGPLQSPGPRAPTLVALAVDTFVEGCIGESVAALIVARGASRCELPPLRAALLRIADEEASHAALAWRTVAWAIGRGGAPVSDAILREARARRPGSAAGGGPHSRAFAAHGRLTEREIARATHDTWTHVIEPALGDLVARRAHLSAHTAA